MCPIFLNFTVSRMTSKAIVDLFLPLDIFPAGGLQVQFELVAL